MVCYFNPNRTIFQFAGTSPSCWETDRTIDQGEIEFMSEKHPECPLYNPLNCKEYYNPKLCAFVRKDKVCLKKKKPKPKKKS